MENKLTRLSIAMVISAALSGCGSNTGSSTTNTAGSAAPTSTNTATSTAGTNPAQLVPANVVTRSINSTEPSSVATTNNSAPISSSTPQSGQGAIALSGPSAASLQNAPAEEPLTEKGAFRLLQQATFGATEAGITEAMAKGPKRWVAEQFAMPVSTYGYRDRDAIHKWTDKNTRFCDRFPEGTPERDACWRDWYATDLIKLDFFKQASLGTDQLRQRIALALSQIIVTSEIEIEGLYGIADYQQRLRDIAFGTYRDVLLTAATHPVMGKYLNMVNNDASDPNENFARELLQLFSIGTCALNMDGSLQSGKCVATYTNDTVREYAYALTGWTYPAGGVDPWCTNGSNCGWENPTYLKGSMVAVESAHDKAARSLAGGAKLAAGHSANQGLNAVIDSLMNHPNIAPFIAKQLIQFFVASNPSPSYINRVASAFVAGKYDSFGSGAKGDLQATIAAVLLDAEARADGSMDAPTAGKLREPIVMMVASIRALNGYTDGERLGKYGWGSSLSQPLFNSPSVFNFYAPDYPLPSSSGSSGLLAPQFQLTNANTTLGWANFANDVIYWWYNKGAGIDAKAGLEGATGSKVSYAAFEPDAGDIAKLVARLDRVLTGSKLGAAGRAAIASAVAAYSSADTWLTDANNQSSWQRERVKTAAYLIISSAHFQVQR